MYYEEEFELTFDLPESETEPEPAPEKLVPEEQKPGPERRQAPAPALEPETDPIRTVETATPAASAVISASPVVPTAPVIPVPPEIPKVSVQKRTVLISGGDRGIGAAAARAFCAAGYRVAILYRQNETAARALTSQLEECAAFQCDVASRSSCADAFARAQAFLGQVDVLICNAGIAQQKLFTDLTPEEWQHMLDVNLTGAFHLCQLALPGMIRRKAGRILTVSSMWGQTGGSCEVHYSAAKAGLIGLTKALAKEEGPSGITVNCVAPGVIDTDMMSDFTPADKAALAEETPVGRLGSAEDVAQLLLFLAGENAGYITGQVFGINGGLVI